MPEATDPSTSRTFGGNIIIKQNSQYRQLGMRYTQKNKVIIIITFKVKIGYLHFK